MATHWGSPCPLCGRLVRGWEKQMTEACPWLKCMERRRRDAMVADPVTVSPDTPIAEVARLLQTRHIHRLCG